MSGADQQVEAAALAAIDSSDLARDVSELVRIPSITGSERDALERLADMAGERGLAAEIREYDLAALRAAAGYPGEVAPRHELLGLTITLAGRNRGAPRFCLNGHIDVVDPGARAWTRDPWSGDIADGRVHGRGSVDMKGGVLACLHALDAVRAAGGSEGDVVLEVVSSEEDGGLGTFAALERDAEFDGALIAEPTGLTVTCAQAGSLQFEGYVYGRSAHAAMRLEGRSAIDRYIPVHQAIASYEREINASVEHDLMSALPLAYPVCVGIVEAGRWAAQVPDRLRFAGRVGVPIGGSVESARARFRECLRASLDTSGAPLELRWTGTFRPSETPADHDLVRLVQTAVGNELGEPGRLSGVPWGADMQHYRRREIPCVMFGTTGIERAHAANEFVELDELVTVARTITRVLARFGLGGE